MLLFKAKPFIIPGKTRQQYKNNKFKIIAPALNDEFEFPDGLHKQD